MNRGGVDVVPIGTFVACESMHHTRGGRSPMLMRRTGLAAAVLALALTVAACGSDEPSAPDAEKSKGKIVVGAFNFPESEIMANIYADLLDKAGYEATVKSLGAREIVQPALEKGEIDLVPEYVGTFTEFLNTKINGKDAKPLANGDVEETLAAAQKLGKERGLVVLEPAAAQDQNAFAVTKDFSESNSITKLSQLGEFSGTLVLGGPPECPQRPFCRPGLEKTYGITLTGFKAYQKFPLIKEALKDGDIQLGLVFSSDAGNAVNNLVVLEDDKGLQTVDNLTPVVRADKASESLESALAQINKELTTEVLIGLNNKVENERQTPNNVAKEWLQQIKLI